MLSKHQNEIPLTAIHRDSRVISKIQPKIRIIHIFAPEIIQTDVANFRELVQRLTGKPSPPSTTTTTTSPEELRLRDQSMEAVNNKMAAGDHHQSHNYNYKPVVNVNVNVSHDDHHRDNINGGFLEVFDGVNDYFVQQMGEFSASGDLQPHNHHAFEDTFHSFSYRGFN